MYSSIALRLTCFFVFGGMGQPMCFFHIQKMLVQCTVSASLLLYLPGGNWEPWGFRLGRWGNLRESYYWRILLRLQWYSQLRWFRLIFDHRPICHTLSKKNWFGFHVQCKIKTSWSWDYISFHCTSPWLGTGTSRFEATKFMSIVALCLSFLNQRIGWL